MRSIDVTQWESGPAATPGLDELVYEIAACSNFLPGTIRRRLWRQATGFGNVQNDAPGAFIFETLLLAQRPARRAWSMESLERIRSHAREVERPAESLRILVFGDGCGEDTLFLARHGMSVDYFDIPGSRTSAFAERRFRYHRVAGTAVRVVSDLAQVSAGSYDVVISPEVLEHASEPCMAFEQIAALLTTGGIEIRWNS